MEFKEEAYILEDYKVQTEPPSGETVYTSLGIGLLDFLPVEDRRKFAINRRDEDVFFLIDDEIFKFLLRKNDNLSLTDKHFLKFLLRKGDNFSLTDKHFLKFLLRKSNSISLTDKEIFKFLMRKKENIPLSDKIKMIIKLRQYDRITLIDNIFSTNKEQYFGWFFTNPLDKNFTFKEDTNLDGLADDLEVTNGSWKLVKEDFRQHIQEINLNSGSAVLTIDVPSYLQRRNNFYLYFNIKMLSGVVDLDVNVYWDDVKLSQAWHQRYIAGEHNNQWFERLLKWLIYRVPLFNKIKLEFSAVSADFYIDNVVVGKDKGFLRNPEKFEYESSEHNIEINNLISEKNIYLVYSGIENKNIRLYWGVINRLGLKFLKKLMNKDVLLRTHDRRIIVGKIVSMSVNYIPRTQFPILKLQLGIKEE